MRRVRHIFSPQSRHHHHQQQENNGTEQRSASTGYLSSSPESLIGEQSMSIAAVVAAAAHQTGSDSSSFTTATASQQVASIQFCAQSRSDDTPQLVLKGSFSEEKPSGVKNSTENRDDYEEVIQFSTSDEDQDSCKSETDLVGCQEKVLPKANAVETFDPGPTTASTSQDVSSLVEDHPAEVSATTMSTEFVDDEEQTLCRSNVGGGGGLSTDNKHEEAPTTAITGATTSLAELAKFNMRTILPKEYGLSYGDQQEHQQQYGQHLQQQTPDRPQPPQHSLFIYRWNQREKSTLERSENLTPPPTDGGMSSKEGDMSAISQLDMLAISALDSSLTTSPRPDTLSSSSCSKSRLRPRCDVDVDEEAANHAPGGGLLSSSKTTPTTQQSSRNDLELHHHNPAISSCRVLLFLVIIIGFGLGTSFCGSRLALRKEHAHDGIAPVVYPSTESSSASSTSSSCQSHDHLLEFQIEFDTAPADVGIYLRQPTEAHNSHSYNPMTIWSYEPGTFRSFTQILGRSNLYQICLPSTRNYEFEIVDTDSDGLVSSHGSAVADWSISIDGSWSLWYGGNLIAEYVGDCHHGTNNTFCGSYCSCSFLLSNTLNEFNGSCETNCTT